MVNSEFSRSSAAIFMFALISAGAMAGPAEQASETHRDAHQRFLEEVVVSAPFEATAAETTQPITVLSGEALLEEVANTLGETLSGEVGVNIASFGPGVGHPVIRGHTGNRVGILQNGVGTTDVSNQSPDHAEAVEVSLADRIEIIRGPASLLYGSGAIGGVVNIVDGRIPEQVPEAADFMIEHTYNDNNEENRTVFRLDAGVGNVAFHVEGFDRRNDDIEIPGFALDEAAIEGLEELLHGEHDEDEEHDEEEEALENTRGFVGNSDAESQGGSIGISFVGERGFLGFSVSQMDNDYGLPPGSHSHDHHHEEGEEHDDEEHEDEHEEEGELEFVRLEMEKTRLDVRGGLDFATGFVSGLRFSFANTDYAHDEVEFFEDGDQIVGTRFENEGYEGRLVLNRRTTGAWSGVAGIQFTDNEFEAAGEEAFIPRSDIRNFGIFAFEQYQGERYNVELGLRYDANEVESGACQSDESAFSASGSVLYSLNDTSNMFFGLTRAVRTPSVEELFANVDTGTCARHEDDEDLVFHAATNLLEIGNPNLDKEHSNNFEVGYRYFAGPVTGEISVYLNDIEDYIFLNLTGQEYEEQLIAEFIANDARFRGIEAQLHFPIYQGNRFGVNSSIFADHVRADFDAGGDVPLVPATKFGGELEFYGERWTVHFHALRVQEQDNVGNFELATEGYNLFSAYADYHWDVGTRGELKLFLRGDNLSDEEVRNHASRLKNFAPELGRNFRLGVRYSL